MGTRKDEAKLNCHLKSNSVTVSFFIGLIWHIFFFPSVIISQLNWRTEPKTTLSVFRDVNQNCANSGFSSWFSHSAESSCRHVLYCCLCGHLPVGIIIICPRMWRLKIDLCSTWAWHEEQTKSKSDITDKCSLSTCSPIVFFEVLSFKVIFDYFIGGVAQTLNILGINPSLSFLKWPRIFNPSRL